MGIQPKLNYGPGNRTYIGCKHLAPPSFAVPEIIISATSGEPYTVRLCLLSIPLPRNAKFGASRPSCRIHAITSAKGLQYVNNWL